VVPKVFGVADYDSAVRISKFKMADPKWQLLFSIINNYYFQLLLFLIINKVIRLLGFGVIQNSKIFFEKTSVSKNLQKI